MVPRAHRSVWQSCARGAAAMRKRSLQPTRVTPDPRPRQKQQNRCSGVPIIQTRLRKVPPEREREEAAVPEAIERLISRGPPAGSGIPFEAWRSWHRYGFIACPASKLRHTCSDHCCRMGADCRELDGPLRPTARLSAIGTFARSTRARQANRFAERPEFCDQYARDRGSAETVPSSSRRALPGRKLQFTNPFISSPTTRTP
jgi:hypothetical protein